MKSLTEPKVANLGICNMKVNRLESLINECMDLEGCPRDPEDLD
jgi:hypothetical protein